MLPLTCDVFTVSRLLSLNDTEELALARKQYMQRSLLRFFVLHLRDIRKKILRVLCVYSAYLLLFTLSVPYPYSQ